MGSCWSLSWSPGPTRAPVESAGKAERKSGSGSWSGTVATSEMTEGGWHLRKTCGYHVKQRCGEHTDLLGSLSQAEVSKPLLLPRPPSPVPPLPVLNQTRAGQPSQGWVGPSQRISGDLHVHSHVCIPVKGGIRLPAPGIGSWNHSTPKTWQVCGCWEGG